MHSALFQAICKVGIFMICAQAITHFRPREVYEKYLKLLVSVMILIQLFLPVGGFLLGESTEETAGRLAFFREGLEREFQLSSLEAEETDKLLEQMTLEEVRRRMTEQEKESGEETKAADSESGIHVSVNPVKIENGD